MRQRQFAVIVVAVLLLTAGCLGGGGGDGDADAGGSGDGAADGSSGGGQSDGGSSDASDEEFELADSEQQLRNAGSFTVVWTYRGVDERGVETEVTREFAADLEAERSLTSISSVVDGESDSGTMQQFFADGRTYVRSGSDDSPTYFSYEQESQDVVATAIALSQARAYGADDDLDFAGTETFDGVSVQRYELSETDSQLIQAGSAAGVAAGGSSGDMTITDFHYTVLVDGDGLSRFESWSFTAESDDGTKVSGEWEYSLTKVGSTTVDDPEWLAEAQAQAQG